MQWEFIVALIIAIPIILFPVAYIWYLNFGGAYAAFKKAREKRARLGGAMQQEYETALAEALKRYPWHRG